MEKTTYRSAVAYALSHLVDAPQDVVDKLTSLEASLVAKASAERKPTAKQTANESYKQDIVDFMKPNTFYSVQDVFKGVESWANDADMTPARVSALLTQLKKAGTIVRTEDHHKAFFSLA